MFLYTLTDGIKDAFGVGYGAQVPFILEGKFLTFVPEFKRLKIYSATIVDMDVYIWKKGEWQKIGEIKDNKDDVIEFKFDEKIKTVKMKILVKKVKPNTRPEIYEIEMYEN
ncbi:MAG: hypothetical protein ACP5OB_07045 [Candidatus Ratteibacteria bacterium]